jgi:hypothetical protein
LSKNCVLLVRMMFYFLQIDVNKHVLQIHVQKSRQSYLPVI